MISSRSTMAAALTALSFLLTSLVFNTVLATSSDRKTTQEYFIGSRSGEGRSKSNNEFHSNSIKLRCQKSTTTSHAPLTLPQETATLVFADQRLKAVYPVIQKFKSIITSDHLGVTKSWVGSDICSYRGFYCDHPPDNQSAIALASIDFNGFQIGAPTLDGFLDQLPDIALFHANSNKFCGTISPNICKLPYLYEFDISNNQFSGPFPMAVLGMNSLTFLDIRFNRFSGSVPPQIFTENLDVLFINNNNFMQMLPDSLSISHVLYLTLANNKFTGPIPGGFLKEATVFDASENHLTGPLPLSLGCLKKVEQLNFTGNQLYGMVPEVVCKLENLMNLSLSSNYFTNIGPYCLFLIERGVLDVRNNCIPGLPSQRSVVECVDFLSYPRTCPYMWSYTYIPCVLHFGPPVTSIPEMAPTP
ncbi:uncharacterized protein At4g06744-like isoform X2 [Carya illinoinensis]|uniref:Uncharacterized protein n=1 Tax=Carya illinoinensis TaxID=32201 RepID=A0A8T1N9I7_CARIL|nr:uncharacterized protein At4g06744-like isoform X2 [Carya illinoinensis]KAG6626501.1 hypothetical protein CIPAW_15G053400 [Carya illinoinensis]